MRALHCYVDARAVRSSRDGPSRVRRSVASIRSLWVQFMAQTCGLARFSPSSPSCQFLCSNSRVIK